MPAALSCLLTPPNTNRAAGGNSTEMQQGLAEVSTQAENKLAAAVLFAEVAVPGMRAALFPSPIASPGKSGRAPVEQDAAEFNRILPTA